MRELIGQTLPAVPGMIVDYIGAHEVIGVELLHLSKRSSDLNLSVLECETA